MTSDSVAVENRLWATASQLSHTGLEQAEFSAPDSVQATPSFNGNDSRGELPSYDKRWQYGVPPAGNAWSIQGGAT